MNDCCEKCRFWRQPGMACNPGECHRRAPNYAGHGGRHWPAVNRDDWCGEFEIREDVKPCVECGQPSGEDGMANMVHNVIIGRICKVCIEKGPKEENPSNPCVECGKGTEPELGYVPFYSGGGELKFIHQTCANERFKRGEKIYQ